MVDILDCTLRDGSYAIDFAFSAKDTHDVSLRLSELGFPYIEVGHGIGLGASAKGMGIAAETDEAYMLSASGNWGMFCIPGVAELDDVRKLAGHGAGFIRIGSDMSKVESCEPYIRLARKLGLYVFSNLMKSYAVPVNEFIAAGAKCIDYGAECIYLVDSAGGMLPKDIDAYAHAIHDSKWPSVKLGFHGHNNIGMGVANALRCVELGFDVIDTTLQGIGRGGGNVPTEQFLAATKDERYDPIAVMQAGEDLIRPLIRDAGLSSLDVTAGMAQFHSSYMPRILAVAKKLRIDPRRLIVAVAAVDKVNCRTDLVERCAEELVGMESHRIVTKAYYGEEQL
jgi:4-hydroxy 2-oxovalerate aldolase